MIVIYWVLGLTFLCFWLRGSLIAALLLLLFTRMLAGFAGHVPTWSADGEIVVFAFAPWLLWQTFSAARNPVVAEMRAREQAKKQAYRRGVEADTRAHQEWMARPAEERARLRLEWKTATRAERAAIRRRLDAASTAAAPLAGSASDWQSPALRSG